MAADSNSDEAELEAFFRCGDEGTYEGGPSSSIAPVHTELEERATEPAFEAALTRRLERRARYQQLVTRLVGVLGLCVLLAVTVRAAALRGSDSAPASRPADERLALGVAPPAPERLDSVTAPAPEEAAPVPLKEEPAEPALVSSAVAAPKPSTARPRKAAPAFHADAKPQPPPAVSRPLPRASASFPSASHSPPPSHSPSSVSFPD